MHPPQNPLLGGEGVGQSPILTLKMWRFLMARVRKMALRKERVRRGIQRSASKKNRMPDPFPWGIPS